MLKPKNISKLLLFLFFIMNLHLIADDTSTTAMDKNSELNLTERDVDSDFGDAPEGVLAYPSLGVMGLFPTCMNVPLSGFVMHGLCWAYFGSFGDFEPDGNAGMCPTFSPNLYNQDECFNDGDAGLLFPSAFTIQGSPGSETVVSCDGTTAPLGNSCQLAVWGGNLDIHLVNGMPVDGFVNVLMDWDQNGSWSGSSNCPDGSVAVEHVLQNHPVPMGFNGPLSALMPPPFLIGPNTGYVWTRFTISEAPVPPDWFGDGIFEDGETEDYLLLVQDDLDQFDWGDAPDPSYPTLAANSGAYHLIDGITMLGSSIDAETDGQPTAGADGDDNDGNDDEDGVTFPILYAGQQAQISVTVSGGGYLDAWFDFNGNGSWLDPGEYISTAYLSAGTHQIGVNIPASAIIGNTYCRFRLSTSGGLTPTGYSPDGEVEDYQIEIVEYVSEIKWEQLPDLTPLGIDIDATDPLILADDFLCTFPGLITDIHVWGSWRFDELPAGNPDQVFFTLSIHEDIPDPDGEGPLYSMPGEIIWIMEFDSTMFTSELYFEGIEGWYDPSLPEYLPEGDTQCWLYNFYIPEDLAFLQQGTAESPKVYWLDVQAHTPDPIFRFGWKTAETHWNDDAVWGIGSEPYPGPWEELIYPPGHPFHPESIDLAFSITTTSEIPDDEFDWGDAPDPSYPTLAANGGANHTIVAGSYLGSSIDAETNGQPTSGADGDDNDGNNDDDGVIFMQKLLPGHNSQVNITASVPGFIHAWIDFNRDGDWADSGENIFSDLSVTAGSNSLFFPVPFTASPGSTIARFRYITTSSPSLSYTGNFFGGEVEDYLVRIDSLDYGDAFETGTSYPTTLANDGARHVILPGYTLGNQASSIDAENDGQPHSHALGDDHDGNDDEDGITLTTMIPGQSAILDVTTSLSIGGYTVGYLDAWIDFNADGDWDDPGEQIANTLTLSPLGFNSFFVSVPADATPNTFTCARFRFSSTGGLNYYGAAADGEVEDYHFYIAEDLGESKILNPQWPDTTPLGVDVNAEFPVILADDFMCVQTGAITDIIIWGSWLNDMVSDSPIFQLGFWTDVPDPDGEGPLYSMPGELLWDHTFLPGEYLSEPAINLYEGEYWYDPLTSLLIPSADYFIWRYWFTIPKELAYVQQEGVIYWLSVQVTDPADPENILNFGWKTSPNHWNDDAVWATSGAGRYSWQEMIYPDGHPSHPASMDLSFFISGSQQPDAPENIYIVRMSDRMKVEWDTVNGASSYHVYYSTDPYAAFPSGWTLLGSTANLYIHDGPPMPSGAKKFYRVTAEY